MFLHRLLRANPKTGHPSLISHLLILYQIWIFKKYFFPLCPLQTCNWAQVLCPALWAFFPAFLPGCKNLLCFLPSSFYIHVLIVTWLQFKDSDLGSLSASELHLDPFCPNWYIFKFIFKQRIFLLEGMKGAIWLRGCNKGRHK